MTLQETPAEKSVEALGISSSFCRIVLVMLAIFILDSTKAFSGTICITLCWKGIHNYSGTAPKISLVVLFLELLLH